MNEDSPDAAQRQEPLDPEVRDHVERLIDLPPALQRAKIDELRRRAPEVAERVERELVAAAPRSVDWANLMVDEFKPGSAIGPYTILSQIGDGGFGDVFKAERRQPHRQTIAIKVIKPGRDSREVVARFAAERQALAIMTHPNIARIIDGGITANGRPFFVMEFVPGQPVTQFADENRLTLAERLALFQQVCDAIIHAHQKAIIHRDIKASNVLAFFQDGKPTVKVIDFGIAKAIGASPLTDLTFDTADGQMPGTLVSMSPEQANSELDIDVRTDVYSLGVLLYELLAGVKWLDREALSGSTPRQIQSMICDREPERPSSKVTALDLDAQEQCASARRLKLDDLQQTLRSELEWIPLMAMRRLRRERYESVRRLSEDIDNYLQGRPLEAGPESLWYRVGKFVQRHRLPLAAAAAILFAILLGLGGTSWWMTEAWAQAELKEREATRARSAEADARAAERVAEDRRVEAEAEAKTTLEAVDFIVSVFASADPMTQTEVTQSLPQLLETGAKNLEPRFGERPLLKARIADALGQISHAFGQLDLAKSLFENAVRLRGNAVPDTDPQAIRTQNRLSSVRHALNDHGEAVEGFRQAAERALAAHGPDELETLATQAALAAALNDDGRSVQAEALFADIVPRMVEHLGPLNATTLLTKGNWAIAKERTGDVQAAEALYGESLAPLTAVLGRDHPTTLTVAANYADLLRMTGRFDEALDLHLRVLEDRRRTLPEAHPELLTSINNLAVVYQELGQNEKALPLQRESLAGHQEVLGSRNPTTLMVHSNLGLALARLERLDEAAAVFEEVVELRTLALGRDDLKTVESLSNLAVIHYLNEDFANAATALEAAIDGRLKVFPTSDDGTTQLVDMLLRSLEETGNAEKAATVREQFHRE